MQVDSNCDGVLPQAGADASCDAAIPVGAPSGAADACRAMDLCNVAVPDDSAPFDAQRTWGVIEATFTGIDKPGLSGTSTPALPTDWGVLDSFGPATNPQGGTRLLALSSGEARAPGQPDFVSSTTKDQCEFDKGYSSGFPPLGTWPKQGTCGTTGKPHDGVALDLKLRAPTNARALSFDFRFFTCEFPQYVCMVYNDVFAVLMVDATDASTSPIPMTDPIYPDVSFDVSSSGMREVIGVNNQDFLSACQPGQVSGYDACAGTSQLTGSGFAANESMTAAGAHGASGWLVTQVPVTPGHTYVIRLAIWDSQDGILDSTAVVDGFRWLESPVSAASTTIVPNPH
jgi:hypothetical protein